MATLNQRPWVSPINADTFFLFWLSPILLLKESFILRPCVLVSNPGFSGRGALVIFVGLGLVGCGFQYWVWRPKMFSVMSPWWWRWKFMGLPRASSSAANYRLCLRAQSFTERCLWVTCWCGNIRWIAKACEWHLVHFIDLVELENYLL